MTMTTLIRNGTVIDPAGGIHAVRDLWIKDGAIDAPQAHADEVIDVAGKIVAPGFVDIHMHEDGVDADESSEAEAENGADAE